MMYVRDLNADSTWLTELAFFVTNSSYSGSHLEGCNSAAGIGFWARHEDSIFKRKPCKDRGKLDVFSIKKCQAKK